MSDDIETLRTFIAGVCTDKGRREARPEAIAALDRIVADRDSLRKALDDRYAADLRAAKAIFAESGRTSGFPSVKEVVAFYVAEVERLEKELREARMAEHQTFMDAAAINVENDSFRAQFARAVKLLEPFGDLRNDGVHLWNAQASDFKRVRKFLDELAQQPPKELP